MCIQPCVQKKNHTNQNTQQIKELYLFLNSNIKYTQKSYLD